MKNLILFAALAFVSLTACNQKAQEKPAPSVSQTTPTDLALVPNDWIAKRVSKSKHRLQGTAAGKIVWNAMKANGGLAKWYANGPLSFRFQYQPLDSSTPRDTYQIIDTWRSTARHYHAKDSSQQFGWEGKTAWQLAKDSTAFAYNTRFWALTPYFFIGQPFVLDGSGVQLKQLPNTVYQDRMQEVIRVTFDTGTGDAPDDYYVLYFDAETHKLAVIRYIVSYPGYFKNGGHSPEKLMELGAYHTVDGIALPTTYKTFWLSAEGEADEHITDITVSDIKFQPKAKKSIFGIPEKATVVEGL
ncbi:Hypothetical protein I595_1124 [Croceitalea dokdonensis DOKDO 023]|uniref:Lipoprotein n=1 Tax=Croceitalea dokdonensis DOKDO 023 TaxID=1300341 RepID=A0A0P7B150_9FLAO|nr:hypothetical protein [Croceitalea dokdonensis]KPM32697.1 Hypothetical protein I595_1124 [Croceitalea dokdonensis DOKDO 023]